MPLIPGISGAYGKTGHVNAKQEHRLLQKARRLDDLAKISRNVIDDFSSGD
ncbi:hypothetical protein MIZ01_1065 [Sideroxyarcus emersonii]|uniref:Uncharacterized protein n=1 Tax=Sideroxyarcus emersonii TaxID=2764705 RepID=A0AAN2BYQ1_9PROT|nr:hypothetical protein MIZ01_1065 [Sideroxyarcus emersonii]